MTAIYTDGFDKYTSGGGRFARDVVHARITPTKDKTAVTWFRELKRPPLATRLFRAFFPANRQVHINLVYSTKTDQWETLDATVEVPQDATYVALDMEVLLNGQKYLSIGREPSIIEVKGQ